MIAMLSGAFAVSVPPRANQRHRAHQNFPSVRACNGIHPSGIRSEPPGQSVKRRVSLPQFDNNTSCPQQTLTWSDVLRDLADTTGTKRFGSLEYGTVQRQWQRHREIRRYVRHTLGFPLSKLARRLAPVCILVAAESVIASAFHEVFGVNLHLNETPIALMSGVVGLLLAFRTNASLARYYEARGAWNVVVARSCDIVRVGLEYIDFRAKAREIRGGPSNELRSHQLVRYVAAFPYILQSYLEASPSSALEGGVGHLLNDVELATVLQSANPPKACLQLMTLAAGESVPMDHHVRVKLDGGITALLEAAATAEKLLRTPIPLSYTRHTSRVCLLWCFSMPLVLFSEMGPMGSSIASALITFVLLGIEDIGVQIEDPFRILPISELCIGIEIDVFDMERNNNLFRQTAPEVV